MVEIWNASGLDNICGIVGALAAVIAASVAGATVLALCELGDKFIVEAADKVYAKGKVPKGVSCLCVICVMCSVGNVLCIAINVVDTHAY